MKIKYLTVLAAFGSSSVSAQLEEIVVTASSGASYYDMPAVTLEKKADFLVQNIQLINDSRSPKLRRSEIFSTIGNLIKNSKKVDGIELS